jgi:signal transduction histidine kinase
MDRVYAGKDFQSFILIDETVYALAVTQILPSEGAGVPAGHLLFVERVGDGEAAEALQVQARIVPSVASGAVTIRKELKHVAIAAPLKDVHGTVVAALTLKVERPLMAAASKLTGITLAAALAVAVAMLVMLQWRLRSLVSVPVNSLYNHLQAIRLTGELRTLHAITRNDEFGAVQEEFNRMAKELQELRARLESQSFSMGITQSAIGLMHNLRNGLAPLRVILDKLEQQIGLPMPPQTARALDELSNPGTEEQRRDKLVQFLAAAHDQLSARSAENHYAVREAARHLHNALVAIDAVQDSKSDIKVTERCDLPGMLSHAANLARFSEGEKIAVEVNSPGAAIVCGNRVLLSQVLENLVMNAVEALRKCAQADGAIKIGASVDQAAGFCWIVITDNGPGFAPDLAPRLFEREFSTREGRAGGLGLHWCANTVRAMNGDLQLQSKGPGLGAQATLTLPLWREPAGYAALAA